MINFSSVTRKFGKVEAVKDLNFTIGEGEVVGLLGSNGAGKTTTMRLMTGYYPPTEGRVEIAGKSILRNPGFVKKKLGYLPEKPPLYDEMTVAGYLDFTAALREVSGSVRPERIEAVLDKLDLAEQSGRLLGNLSRGYRQRVALAQALVHGPDVLVLDEPTLGLDPAQVRQLRDLIRDLAEDTTLVISSHVLHEIRLLCERVLILKEGQMLAVDSPEELSRGLRGGENWQLEVNRPPGDWEQQLEELEPVRSVERLSETEFQVCFLEGSPGERESLFELCRQKDVPLTRLSPPELDLEEIFIELTERGGGRLNEVTAGVSPAGTNGQSRSGRKEAD